ncbi:hypothetical protein TNCV_362741 [Trichonephila clavipes]|nr:hypothetical protein TNCV_362741 [Trichonephila clavipes]
MGTSGIRKPCGRVGKFVLPILHTLLMLALLRECSCFFLFQDIMPSGLTVHWVLIAPRDSILQNVETDSMFHLAFAPLEEPPRDSDPPVLHFTRDLLHRTTTSL